MIEEWKNVTVAKYKDLYLVSNLGFVKNIKTNQILKPLFRHKNSFYTSVDLFSNGKGKHFYIHRLVALAFIPNKDKLPQVNHIDGNKLNNIYYNLEWVTPKQNISHAWESGLMNKRKSKLSKKDIFEIKSTYTPKHQIFGRKALAKKFNINPRTIYEVIHNY